MATVSVIYPNGPEATFNHEYYREQHLPLVVERWKGAGLIGVDALAGAANPDGSPPAFLAITLLRFRSFQDFRAIMGGATAADVLADIPNFTSVRPLLQLNEPVRPAAPTA